MSQTRKVFTLGLSAAQHSTIDILVENQGRLCYGTHINERKGILSNVIIDKQNITNWNHYRLFDNWNSVLAKVHSFNASEHHQNGPHIPAFYSASFQLPYMTFYPKDSFLQVTSWHKGVAFLNGHNLGRYWPVAGPQLTLYAPSVYFHPYPQMNEIVLFELESSPCSAGEHCQIEFVDKHILNGTIPKH